MNRFALLASIPLLAACGGMMRTADQYRDDTAKLLAGKSDDIEACYKTELETRPKAGGTVTVTFTVARETGRIGRIKVAEASTAPTPLRQCVENALEGLELKPPDAQIGEATFVWEFEPAPAPAAAEEPSG